MSHELPVGSFWNVTRKPTSTPVEPESFDCKAPDSAPAPETAVWSRDGRSIYFKSHDAEGHAMISVIPASGGTPRPIVRFPDLSRPSSRQGFAMSATRFYFPIEDRQSNVWIADLSH